MPELRKGFPTGNLDLGIDREGQLLLGMMYQGAVARFDPKTEKFQIRQLPPERLKDDLQLNMVTNQAHVDGKLWVNDAGPSTLLRLDLATGKFEEFDPFSILPGGRQQGYSIYDVRADFAEQRLRHGLPEELRRQGRRQDRQVHRLPDRHAALAQPARPHRRSGPLLVRGISRQQDRDARYQGGANPGMAAADQVHAALRRDLGQERSVVDRRHDQRPRDPARSQEQ